MNYLSPAYTPDDLRYFDQSKITDDKLKVRMFMERAIIRALTEAAFAKSYAVKVWDGEAWATGFLRSDLNMVMDSIMATDEEKLVIYRDRMEDDTVPARGRMATSMVRVGFILLVYGNDGYDVVSDYTTNEAISGIVSSLDSYVDWLELRWAIRNRHFINILRAEDGKWISITSEEAPITVHEGYDKAVQYAEKFFPDRRLLTSHYDPVTKEVVL